MQPSLMILQAMTEKLAFLRTKIDEVSREQVNDVQAAVLLLQLKDMHEKLALSLNSLADLMDGRNRRHQ